MTTTTTSTGVSRDFIFAEQERIRDIPSKLTLYNGITFRSALEARWAVFFTYCRRDWSYEPQCVYRNRKPYYLPDFKLGVSARLKPWIVEIKPTEPTRTEMEKACWACKQLDLPTAIFWGIMQGPVAVTQADLLMNVVGIRYFPNEKPDVDDWHKVHINTISQGTFDRLAGAIRIARSYDFTKVQKRKPFLF